MRRHPFGEHDALLVAAGQRLHRVVGVGHLDREVVGSSCRTTRRRGRASRSARSASGKLVEDGDDDVRGDRLLEHEAERQAVLRRHRRCRARSPRGCVRSATGLPSSRISPAVGLVHAEERQRELGAPGAEQAGDARGSRRHGPRSSTSSYSPGRVRRATESTVCRVGRVDLRQVVAEFLARHQRRRASCRSSRAASKVPTLRPSRSTVTRSATSSTSSSRWQTKTMQMPFALEVARRGAAAHRPRGG